MGAPRFASARKRAILKGERRSGRERGGTGRGGERERGERERGLVDNDMPPHASAMRHHLFEEDVAAVAMRSVPLLSKGCREAEKVSQHRKLKKQPI